MESSMSCRLSGRTQAARLGASLGMALLFVALLLWAGAGSRTASPAEARSATVTNGTVITIGVASGMSGPIPATGWQQANAVQLAVDQINAAGGVSLGGITHTLTLVYADDACDPALAPAAADALLDAGAVAVVGHTCSGASFAVQDIYAAAGVPMVSPSASNPGLTEMGYTTTFRLCAKNDAAAHLMATYFRRSLGYDAVALVAWSGSEWSTDAFSDTFGGLGGTVTSLQSVASTDSFTATLAAIRLENPDAIFYADYDAGRAGFLSALADDLGMSVIGWDTLWGDSSLLAGYPPAAGAAADGDYAGVVGRDAGDMPGYAAFNAAYQAAGFPNYGDDAGAAGAFAYDAARVIIAAIDRAGSVDLTEIRDEIAATAQHEGVVGTYTGFDAKGDVIPQWAWLVHYQNGEWVALPSASVGLVTEGPGLEEGGLDWMAYQGLLQAQSDLGVSGVVYTSTSAADYEPNLQQCADDGNDLCISLGWLMSAATINAAEANTGTLFAIVDTVLESYPPNVSGFTFASDEAGYLAGTLAGLMTENDVVGDIGGMAIPTVDAFVYGYRNGAQCSNLAATVLITYAGDFSDPALGATLAQDMIAQGADVIFAPGGSTGVGAVLTATQSGVWGIGVDTDYYDTVFAGGTVSGSDRLLSSAMKRFDSAVYTAAEDVLAGTFASGNQVLDLEADGVGLASFHDADSLVPQAVRDRLKEVKQGIVAGTIDIADPCRHFVYLPLVARGH